MCSDGSRRAPTTSSLPLKTMAALALGLGFGPGLDLRSTASAQSGLQTLPQTQIPDAGTQGGQTPGAALPGPGLGSGLGAPTDTLSSAGAPRQIAPWLSRALSGEGSAAETVAPVAPPEAIVPTPGLTPAPNATVGAIGGQTGGPTGRQTGVAGGPPTGPLDPNASNGSAPSAEGAPGAVAGVGGSSAPSAPGGALFPSAGSPRSAPPTDPASVQEAPLDRVDAAAAGIAPASSAGLPVDAWRGTSAEEAVELVEALRPTALHAANRLAVRILIAALRPPQGAAPEIDLLDARLAALGRFGAADLAAQLAEAAGPERVVRAAWVPLISGRDATLCQTLLAGSEPSLERIYCLAVDGQAGPAQLAIRATRDLSAGEADETTLSLLEAMTDPLLVEFAVIPSELDALTPLRLAAMRRIGRAPDNDFARQAPLWMLPAALAPEFTPRLRLEAMERLERAGAVETRRLSDAYRGTPSAESGGVWGRVEAFRRAVGVGAATDGAVYAQAALTAMARAEEAGRGPMMARLLAPETARRARGARSGGVFSLPRDPALRRLLRLGGEADAAAALLAAAGPETVGPEERALDRLAAPRTPGVWNPSDAEELLARAARSDVEGGRLMAALNAFRFATPAPTLYPEPPTLPQDISEGRIAALALGALLTLNRGEETQPEALYEALVTLIELGYEAEARQIAVEAILIGR
ncbi:MAG: hypothetical protein AAFW46_02555 [Pseudomonadota bacterium]